LIEGVLLVVAGILAIIYPVIASAAVVVLLGWLLCERRSKNPSLLKRPGSPVAPE
jgi:hypothetical protein